MVAIWWSRSIRRFRRQVIQSGSSRSHRNLVNPPKNVPIKPPNSAAEKT